MNGDQKLDEKDQNQIIAAVEDQTAEGDLNGDGSTTLVDLQYFAAHYKTGLDTKASVQSSIPGDVRYQCRGNSDRGRRRTAG